MSDDFFLYLQKLSQQEDSGVEVFIDEDGEVEFEIEVEVFEKILDKFYEFENE